ncbi:MAG: phosphate acyltransferase PlsX [Phycisphaerae bacterium]
MRIALDAMGGDHAPREVIRGAVIGMKFLAEKDELVLYGPKDVLETEMREAELTDPRVRIEHCTQVIGMDETPVEGVRQKRDSSIVRMATDAGKKNVDAIISAGNTGAFGAAAVLRVGLIKGASRPGIAVIIPTFAGPVAVCDVGANVAPKAHHLHEYARMCRVYARRILHIEEPRVGIISIGEEEGKGSPLVKEAYSMLKSDTTLNFIGNVEGRDIFAGTGNVFVCDGYVGNVILKLTEGLAEGLFKTIHNELRAEAPELSKQFEPVVERIWKRHDFAEHGGAPLLGVNSVAIICHGRSDRRAISNAVRIAVEQVKCNLNGEMEDQLRQIAESQEVSA